MNLVIIRDDANDPKAFNECLFCWHRKAAAPRHCLGNSVSKEEESKLIENFSLYTWQNKRITCSRFAVNSLFRQKFWYRSKPWNMEKRTNNFMTWIGGHSTLFAQCRSVSHTIFLEPLLSALYTLICCAVFKGLFHLHRDNWFNSIFQWNVHSVTDFLHYWTQNSIHYTMKSIGIRFAALCISSSWPQLSNQKVFVFERLPTQRNLTIRCAWLKCEFVYDEFMSTERVSNHCSVFVCVFSFLTKGNLSFERKICSMDLWNK